MTRPTFRKLILRIAAAAIALPAIATAAAGEAASAVPTAIALDQHAAQGANACISLGAQHRMRHDAMADVVPMLSNRCNYAVTVSYCLADSSADKRACEMAAQRITRAMPPHSSVPVSDSDRTLADKDVNWIACRAIPGGITQFNADGTRGQCLAVSDTMQASVQPSQ